MVSVEMAETLKRQVNPRTIVGERGTCFYHLLCEDSLRDTEICSKPSGLSPNSRPHRHWRRICRLSRLPSFFILLVVISSTAIGAASCHSHGALIAQGNSWHTVRARWICAVLGSSPVLATDDKSLIPNGSLLPLLGPEANSRSDFVRKFVSLVE